MLLNFSCHENEKIPEKPIDYNQFKNALSSNLNEIGDELRKNNNNFTNSEIIETVIKSKIGSNPNRDFTSFLNNYSYTSSLVVDNLSNKISKPKIFVTNYQYEILTRIDKIYYSSENHSQYLKSLASIFEEVSNSPVSEDQKTPILLHVSSQMVALEFISENLDLFNSNYSSNSRTADWWDDWGKCAAGIVGGAGSVGIGGFLGGAAVGTVTFPVVGTVSAAAVGGIGGSIFGGIAGAASACGSGDGECNSSCYVLIEPCEEDSDCNGE